MRTTDPTVPGRIVLSAIAASWLGLVIHNVADLGTDVFVARDALATPEGTTAPPTTARQAAAHSSCF